MVNLVSNYKTDESVVSLFFKKGIYNPFIFSNTNNKTLNIAISIITTLAAVVFGIMTLGTLPTISYFINKNFKILYLNNEQPSLIQMKELKKASKEKDPLANYILGVLAQKNSSRESQEKAGEYFKASADLYLEQLISLEQSSEDLLQRERELISKYSKSLHAAINCFETPNDKLGKLYRQLAELHFWESRQSDGVNALLKAIENEDIWALAFLGHMLKLDPSLLAGHPQIRGLAENMLIAQDETVLADSQDVAIYKSNYGIRRCAIRVESDENNQRNKAILGYVLKNHPDIQLDGKTIQIIAEEFIRTAKNKGAEFSEGELVEVGFSEENIDEAAVL